MGLRDGIYDRDLGPKKEEQPRGTGKRLFVSLLVIVLLLCIPGLIIGGIFLLDYRVRLPAGMEDALLLLSLPLSVLALIVSAGASFSSRISLLQKIALWVVCLGGGAVMLSVLVFLYVLSGMKF